MPQSILTPIESENKIIDKKQNKRDIIANLYNDGFSMRDIADMLNVSHMTVYRIIKSQ